MSSSLLPDWPSLFQTHKPALERHLARQLDSREDIAELLHELYLKVSTLHTKQPIENPKSYLYRIATNLAIDLQRQKRSRANQLDSYQYQMASQMETRTPERIATGRERLRLLEQAIETLPPKCKEVFMLRKLHHLSNPEIADRLGISRNMVEKHLRKALTICREEIERRSQ